MRLKQKWLVGAVVAFCLTAAGCSLLEQAAGEIDQLFNSPAQAVSAAESSSQPARVRSSTSLRRSDLKEIDAVGELVEDEPAKSLPGGEAEPEESSQAEQPLEPQVQHAWDLSLLPYRAMLTPPQQAAYDEIYENIARRQAEFTLVSKMSVNEINDVVHAVYYDNPDFFWLDASYKYSYNTQNIVLGMHIGFNSTAQNFEASEQQFQAAANDILREARKLGSDVEKEKYVHDRLVAQSDYELNSPNNQSAYSALVAGKSVCAGYARAFQYLMMKLGIPCYYCVGVTDEDHAWNIIELDGAFYNVDVAWNDPIGAQEGESYYEYFNLTDEQIAYDHERRELSINLPACTSETLAYDKVFARQGEPTRKGGAPRDYASLGFSQTDVLQTLEEYYAAMRERLSENGAGSHVMRFVLQNKRLQEQVYGAVQSQEWFNKAVIPAAEEMKLNGYSAGIELSAEELADGYVLLTQTVNLSES